MRDNIDVIVTTAASGAVAARKTTKVIPIVVTSGNLVEVGLAKSLAKPGGNVTGLTAMATDLSSKRLEILKETLPKINGIAALWTPREGEWDAGYKEAEAAAKALSLRFHSVEFFTADHLGPAFVEMAKARDSGFIVVLSPFVTLNSKRIVELALKYRLPGMYPTRQLPRKAV